MKKSNVKNDETLTTKCWKMYLPVPVEFGKGAFERLSIHLVGFHKVLVVTGRHAMKAAGVTNRICDLLEKAGTESLVFEKVSPEPNYEEVEEATALAKKFGADIVIGCGGGSAIDAAKAIAVAATHSGSIMDYIVGASYEITKDTLPIIAITSTSGTGSHVGRVAVLSDRNQKIKRALISDYLYPRAAICDPEILCTMPSQVTVNTGFDAFAHALEGYLSTSDNPLGKLCAQEAMRIIYHTLPKVIQRGDDIDLRSKMAWADTLAGISLATNAVVIPHVFGMVIGARYGIAHGPAIASVMVACLRHSRSGAMSKFASISRILGCREPWNDAMLADWAIEAIKQWIADIGLKQSPVAYGVPSDDFSRIAEEVRTVFGLRVEADPVPTDVAGLTRVLHNTIKI